MSLVMVDVGRKVERQALQLLQRAEKKQRDELEQRAAAKRSGLGQQLDQRRQVSSYLYDDYLYSDCMSSYLYDDCTSGLYNVLAETAAVKRSSLGQQLDQRRQVSSYLYDDYLYDDSTSRLYRVLAEKSSVVWRLWNSAL